MVLSFCLDLSVEELHDLLACILILTVLNFRTLYRVWRACSEMCCQATFVMVYSLFQRIFRYRLITTHLSFSMIRLLPEIPLMRRHVGKSIVKLEWQRSLQGICQYQKSGSRHKERLNHLRSHPNWSFDTIKCQGCPDCGPVYCPCYDVYFTEWYSPSGN